MIPLLSSPELQTILSRGEGQFVEFKSAWDHGAEPPKPLCRRALRDKIADAVAAFANAGGGLLLVGVDDDGAATGHGYPDHVVDDLFAVPHRRLTPDVVCRTEILTLGSIHYDGGCCFPGPIAPRSRHDPPHQGGKFPYRIGSRCSR